MSVLVRVFVVVLLLASVTTFVFRNREARLPNVVLITVESLRTDHVGFQDGTKDTTPRLDALAAEATVFTNAWSVTSWTLAAHASLFTGLYPGAHGAVAPLDRLDDGYTTLAETFAAHGYDTAAVVSGPYLRRQHALDQGFDHYDDEPSSPGDVQAHDDVTNPAMLEKLRRWVTGRGDEDRPFFLFAYFWDPHYDFIPPPPWDRKFAARDAVPFDVSGFGTTDKLRADSPLEELEWTLAQYDGEIGFTDDTLGAFFDTLREEGLWEDTIVVVTSDHGEEFFDHGAKGHKNNLFVETTHVPLLVKWAGDVPAARDDRPASLVDLYPTLVEAAGLEAEVLLHGESLRAPDPDPERPLYFELLSTWYYPKEGGRVDVKRQEWFGAMQGGRRLVGVPGERMWLFDRTQDPRERYDLFRDGDRHLPLAERLDVLLRRYMLDVRRTRAAFEASGAGAADRDADPTVDPTVDDEQLERLRSLGYVN